MSDDDSFYSPFRKASPARQPKCGELLFEFYVERTKKVYRCELRDHGDVYGVEAMFFDPLDLVISHCFDSRMNPARTPRAMAVAWAEEERKAIEMGVGEL